jgi:tripartite-type tricarboxylate transporter receptor subunit TctC
VLSGKLRGLAITSKRRSPAVPDLPTFSEAGYPEIDLVGWNGVSVPIGVPPVLVGKINADVRKVLGSREMQDRLIAAGFDPADTTIAQFQAFIDKDVKLYQRIIKESKIRLD